jgi:hypothetical protein
MKSYPSEVDVTTTLLVGVTLVGVVATVWISAVIFVGHWARRSADVRPGAIQRGLVWLHHAVALTPALWIVAAAALVARAFLSVGEWPRAGEWVFWNEFTPPNISARAFGLHYELVEFALTAMFLSVLLFPPLHIAARGWLVRRSRSWLASWIATLLVGVGTLLYDGPYAIADWIL